MKKLLLCLFILAANAAYSQIITTVAGTGVVGYNGDGVQATTAYMFGAAGVCRDNAGNMYINDAQNYRIRKVDVNGIITTICGDGTSGYSGDGGPAINAQIFSVEGNIICDAQGNLYFSDGYNSRVRKIDVNGIITTFAGTGSSGYSGDGGLATNAEFGQPIFIDFDNLGNMFVADRNYNVIRKIDVNGIVTTVAGTGSGGFTGDGGPATQATMNSPISVAADNAGNIYIGDFDNNRVRKVDANGIITTFAGNGNAGYAGDGGPANQAEIGNHWGALACDDIGNVYLADMYNHVIRKIDAGGIINTIVGTGVAGYSGDGGSPLQAQLNSPYAMLIDMPYLYICDGGYCIRRVDLAATYSANDFDIYLQSGCAGPSIQNNVNNYVAGMSITTYYGDGSNTTTAVNTSGIALFSHAYEYSGTYTIKQVLYINTTAVDSFQFSYQHRMCNTFHISFYQDINSDCIHDNNDVAMSKPVLVEVDSAGVAIDTISCTSGFHYDVYGNTGDVYEFKILSLPTGVLASCPVTGVIADTLQAGSNDTKYMGLDCATGNNFDLGITATAHAGPHAFQVYIYGWNMYCYPQNAVLTMNYDPAYPTVYSTDPAPSSQSPGVLTWNLNALSVLSDQYIYVWLENGTNATGTLINTTYSITPTTGDAEPLNNAMVVVDTVDGSFDPNAIYVKPAGCVPAGTNLEYTITFENMGNGPAENIYVMDTLPAGLDANSMKMKFASHDMLVSKIHNGPQTILKFEFPNIMLSDSSDHAGRHGMLTYTIDANSNLSFGTNINHNASIYFDYNPPVATNTAQTTICWPANVKSAIAEKGIAIYPNPAASVITIKSSNAIKDVSLSDVTGREVLHSDKGTIDVSALVSGIYFVRVVDVNGSVSVEKVVKE